MQHRHQRSHASGQYQPAKSSSSATNPAFRHTKKLFTCGEDEMWGPPTPLMLCFYNGSGSGRIDKDYGCQDFPSGHTADLLILLGPCLTAHRPTIGKKKTPKKKSMSSPPPPTAPCSLLKMIHAKDPEIREFKRRKASISLYFYFLSLMKQQGVFVPFGWLQNTHLLSDFIQADSSPPSSPSPHSAPRIYFILTHCSGHAVCIDSLLQLKQMTGRV